MQKQKNKGGRYEALSVTASSSLFVTKTLILNNLNTVLNSILFVVALTWALVGLCFR